MGSTQKMGAGTNVQDRLAAVHHLDAGWKPSDMAQRNGRIVRQGNRNKKVKIFTYVTEATFDAYLYQMLENKQKFISQIMTSKQPARSCEDVDEQVLSFAEVKALCAGNPLIKEKLDLDVEVQRLKTLKADYDGKRYRIEDALRRSPEDAERHRANAAGFKDDLGYVERLEAAEAAEEKAAQEAEAAYIEAMAEAEAEGREHGLEKPEPYKKKFTMTVLGKEYAEREAAGLALIEAAKKVDGVGCRETDAGEYKGFKVSIRYNIVTNEHDIILRREKAYFATLGKNGAGNVMKMDNALRSIGKRLAEAEAKAKAAEAKIADAKAALSAPFEYEKEFKEKSARLDAINAELALDGGGAEAKAAPQKRR